MGNEKLYVYGVTDEPPDPFEADAVAGGTDVYTVDHRSLSAIVSDVGTLDPEESEENVRAHDEVLRSVATRDGGRTVVPMQFGMVFAGERELKNVLRSGRAAFRGALRDVEGCIEVGVKAVAPETWEGDPEAVRETFSDELAPIAERTDRGDQFSDRLVFNRSYLVAREDREAFDEAVGRLQDRFDALTIQYTGPWAPYSFVDLQIGVAQ